MRGLLRFGAELERPGLDCRGEGVGFVGGARGGARGGGAFGGGVRLGGGGFSFSGDFFLGFFCFAGSSGVVTMSASPNSLVRLRGYSRWRR